MSARALNLKAKPASGVSEVKVDGRRVRCLVCGSFQPFLEALRGSEVLSLTAAPAEFIKTIKSYQMKNTTKERKK